jgi:hypothetical protein
MVSKRALADWPLGADKDSEQRQRRAIERFAKSAGFEIVGVVQRPAVSGADPIETRAGFATLLNRIEGMGCGFVLVEDTIRFARDLVAQELGVVALVELVMQDLTATGDSDGHRRPDEGRHAPDSRCERVIRRLTRRDEGTGFRFTAFTVSKELGSDASKAANNALESVPHTGSDLADSASGLASEIQAMARNNLLTMTIGAVLAGVVIGMMSGGSRG